MERWTAIRARLLNAVFAHNSVTNGEVIYQYLSELEQLATPNQKVELQRCQALVQNWSETWYPELITG